MEDQQKNTDTSVVTSNMSDCIPLAETDESIQYKTAENPKVQASPQIEERAISEQEHVNPSLNPPSSHAMPVKKAEVKQGVSNTSDVTQDMETSNRSAYPSDEIRAMWVSQIKSDPEYGGDRFNVTLDDARRALSRFDGSGWIRAMLDETGYGDNPEVIKLCAQIGRSLAEDSMPGSGTPRRRLPSLAERMYPEMIPA